MRVHYLETAAASWELFAAFGWTYTVRNIIRVKFFNNFSDVFMSFFIFIFL